MSYKCIQGHFTDKEHENKNCPYCSKGKVDKLIDKYSDNPSEDKANSNVKKRKLPINKEEFFGVEFKGYKGQEAINKLLKEKKRHIKNAFYRKELGYIDVLWGNDDAGISHIIQQRDKKFYDGIGHILGIDMVNKIVTIIENGEILDTDNKLRIEYDGYRVGISPKYYDEKINWIVTAMEIL